MYAIYLTLLTSLLMVGCASSERTTDARLGATYGLPEPGLGEGGPAYQTEGEDDDLAKADALAVIDGYESLYGLTDPPPVGSELLPEWISSDAVLIAWYEPFADYFDDLMIALSPYTAIWVITTDEGESANLKARWANLGIEMDRVTFYEYKHEAFWTRDYGPWSIKLPDGDIGYLDAKYYPTRYLDDAVPTLLGEFHQVPVFRPKLTAEGGNLIVNGSGLCVTTTRLAYNNPPKRTFEVHEMLNQWAGCEQTIFLEPILGERTGHVDLFARFTQADTMVLGEYDTETDELNAARMDRNADRLSRVRLADGRSLKIHRIPMPPTASQVYPTYTNALTINNALIMPTYAQYPALEAIALDVYKAALPDGTVIETVNADEVILRGGAVHCTTMQLSVLPTNWEKSPADQPGPLSFPEGATGQMPNAKWSSGGTASDTINTLAVGGIEHLGNVEISITVEHRAPETLAIQVEYGGRKVDLPMTNDIAPINERSIVTEAFSGKATNEAWTVTVQGERFNFAGAVLEWWVRPL